MERENQPEPERYHLSYEGKDFELAPDNTVCYMHNLEPEYDHIFVEFEEDPEGVSRGTYLWRRLTEKFDEMVYNLLRVGCTEILKETATVFDKDQYIKRFGNRVTAPVPEVQHRAPELLTPRQENFLAYWRYLLLNDRVLADDFLPEGPWSI